MLRKITIAAAVLGLCGISMGETVAMESEAPALKSDFAINLYQQLAKGEGNLFVSPVSIQSALTMASMGAKGKTAEQMAGVLAIPDAAVFARAISSMGRARADKEASPFKLTIANAMWSQNAYPFDADYVKRVRTLFGAEARSLDFADSEGSRKIINKWVEEKTNQKIKDLIASGALTQDTRLVLTNAVYFNANWAEKFQVNATKEAAFHAPGGEKKVQMMHRTDQLGYMDGGDFHVVSVPYDGRAQAMILIVPKAVDGIAKAEKALTTELAGRFGTIVDRSIELSLPRFKIEQSLSLKQVLSAMGMTMAFDASQADFSGMTTVEKLSISDVVHKSYVKVDEEGTEAAAATAVIMRALSMPAPEDPLQVTLDRPFVFMVRDQQTGSILFMGRVSDPG